MPLAKAPRSKHRARDLREAETRRMKAQLEEDSSKERTLLTEAVTLMSRHLHPLNLEVGGAGSSSCHQSVTG